METPKISIIGAGPAGIAASIQLKRLGYEPRLFEKNLAGGLLWNANLIENYPGFPDGISGPDLIRLMEKQLKLLKIKIDFMQIINLSLENDLFYLKSGKDTIISDYVIVASGTKPKSITINLKEPIKAKIHQDIQRLLDVNGKHIVIIGAGDAAFDHALNLSRNNQISIINRGENIKSLQLLVDRAFSNDKIDYLNNTLVESINLSSNGISKSRHLVQVNCIDNRGEMKTIECNEVVFATGRDPQLDFMDLTAENERCILVGDVKNGIFRQAAIAIGDGIKAAMKIHNQVSER